MAANLVKQKVRLEGLSTDAHKAWRSCEAHEIEEALNPHLPLLHCCQVMMPTHVTDDFRSRLAA